MLRGRCDGMLSVPESLSECACLCSCRCECVSACIFLCLWFCVLSVLVFFCLFVSLAVQPPLITNQLHLMWTKVPPEKEFIPSRPVRRNQCLFLLKTFSSPCFFRNDWFLSTGKNQSVIALSNYATFGSKISMKIPIIEKNHDAYAFGTFVSTFYWSLLVQYLNDISLRPFRNTFSPITSRNYRNNRN